MSHRTWGIRSLLILTLTWPDSVWSEGIPTSIWPDQWPITCMESTVLIHFKYKKKSTWPDLTWPIRKLITSPLRCMQHTDLWDSVASINRRIWQSQVQDLPVLTAPSFRLATETVPSPEIAPSHSGDQFSYPGQALQSLNIWSAGWVHKDTNQWPQLRWVTLMRNNTHTAAILDHEGL